MSIAGVMRGVLHVLDILRLTMLKYVHVEKDILRYPAWSQAVDVSTGVVYSHQLGVR